LQKQVDFLENNEEFAICASVVEEKNDFTNQSHVFPNILENKIYKIEDYILNNHTGTCSLMIKSEFYGLIPDWMQKVSFGDLAIILTVLYKSKKNLMVLKEVMSVYRVNEGGIHGSLKKNNKTLIKAYKMHVDFTKTISKYLFLNNEYSKEVKLKLIITYTKLTELSKKESLKQYVYFYVMQMWYRLKLKIEKLKA